MEQLFKTLSNVKFYYQFKDYLITTGETINIYDSYNLINSYNEDIYSSVLFSNFLVFQNTNGKEVKYIDLDNENFRINILSFEENYYLFKYDILENSLLLKNTNGEICEFNSKLIKKKNTIISRYSKFIDVNKYLNIEERSLLNKSLITGNTLWKKDFPSDIAKIEVWNEKAVVIELYDAHTIIALSSDDGQLLWEQSGWLLHVYENAIYMIYNPNPNTLIVKITDAISGSVINYDLSEILKQNQLLGETMQYTVVDNLIYFSFFYKKIVIIINLQTLELQWLHQIQTNASWINEPRVESSRLYILDSDNTLHIFEKE